MLERQLVVQSVCSPVGDELFDATGRSSVLKVTEAGGVLRPCCASGADTAEPLLAPTSDTASFLQERVWKYHEKTIRVEPTHVEREGSKVVRCMHNREAITFLCNS
tara:strand:+ start:70 stop:387 length:318 start_codon:yes stop_codon:yes gene_type:complete